MSVEKVEHMNRIKEIEDSIKESERRLAESKTATDKYFNTFWRKKIEYAMLLREQHLSPEEQKRLVQLEVDINYMQKKLQEIQPERKIHYFKEIIKDQKAELQGLRERGEGQAAPTKPSVEPST